MLFFFVNFIVKCVGGNFGVTCVAAAAFVAYGNTRDVAV
jgi:hypothetical protein